MDMKRLPVYYIQFRFITATQDKIRKLIYNVNTRFNLKHEREVPHITLAGPFHTSNENRLMDTFYEICKNSSLMYFKVNGFGYFDEKRVIFLTVQPDNLLDEFRWKISRSLQSFNSLSPYDYHREFNFHATIKKNLCSDDFNKLKQFLQKREISFSHLMVRCTLLKNGFILREYNFLLRRFLDRKMALNSGLLRMTMHYLKNNFIV